MVERLICLGPERLDSITLACIELRIWMQASSAAIPICPPQRHRISPSPKWPLAGPPTDGLQGMRHIIHGRSRGSFFPSELPLGLLRSQHGPHLRQQHHNDPQRSCYFLSSSTASYFPTQNCAKISLMISSGTSSPVISPSS